jgi:hypothetical protein
MLAGLVLLEILSISLFAAILTRQQTQRVWMRAQVILAHESASLASQVSDALEQQRPGWISSSVKTAKRRSCHGDRSRGKCFVHQQR